MCCHTQKQNKINKIENIRCVAFICRKIHLPMKIQKKLKNIHIP